MRIVIIPDSLINRYDRALWMTIPFSKSLTAYTAVTPDCRTFDVPFEDREYDVPFEDREYNVPCE